MEYFIRKDEKETRIETAMSLTAMFADGALASAIDAEYNFYRLHWNKNNNDNEKPDRVIWHDSINLDVEKINNMQSKTELLLYLGNIEVADAGVECEVLNLFDTLDSLIDAYNDIFKLEYDALVVEWSLVVHDYDLQFKNCPEMKSKYLGKSYEYVYLNEIISNYKRDRSFRLYFIPNDDTYLEIHWVNYLNWKDYIVKDGDSDDADTDLCIDTSIDDFEF